MTPTATSVRAGRVVVDVAGARVGGAKRFLNELDAHLARTPRAGLSVIGRDRALDPAWLVLREVAARGAGTRIAINNASFAGPGGSRVVSLRNALHFASEAEVKALSFQPSRELRLQVPVIRTLARRADRVEVPCTAMGERVLRYLPTLADRLEVRFHPVAPRPWSTGPGAATGRLLVPIVNAPYKQLDKHLTMLLDAARGVPELDRIVVTAEAEEFSSRVASDPRMEFVGVLRAEELDQHWATSRAIYFPTSMESFGYPLAEARANGRRVVALDTEQSREIAGKALAPFTPTQADSLARALSQAMTEVVEPEPGPFDPDRYFAELWGADRHAEGQR